MVMSVLQVETTIYYYLDDGVRGIVEMWGGKGQIKAWCEVLMIISVLQVGLYV